MQSFLATIMIIPGDIATLIDFFGFTISMFYCAAMVALIVMRFTKKNEHRPIKVYALCCLGQLIILRVFHGQSILINSGTHHHPSYRYGDFGYSSRCTNRCGPTSAILLCSSFYFRWADFLRTFCLLQENGTGNKYGVLIVPIQFSSFIS